MDVSSLITSVSTPISSATTQMLDPSKKVPNSVMDVKPIQQSVGNPLVNAVLEDVNTYNSLLWMQQNTNWSNMVARRGQAAADQAKALDDATIANFGRMVQQEAGAASIPVSSSKDEAQTLTVSDATFKSGDTEFSVKTHPDGRMTATSNGKPWKTWDAPSFSQLKKDDTPGSVAMQLLQVKGFYATSA